MCSLPHPIIHLCRKFHCYPAHIPDCRNSDILWVCSHSSDGKLLGTSYTRLPLKVIKKKRQLSWLTALKEEGLQSVRACSYKVSRWQSHCF